MKKIVLKLFLAFLPILFIVGTYLHDDPFKVIYHYNSYFPEYGPQYVVLNKDFVSTETFLNNYDKYHYDSYIFGNSRSMEYRINEWEKHINSTRCFHFDSYGESLLGIERKINFLHKKRVRIKNALFVLDNWILEKTKTEKHEKHFLIIDPEVSGTSKIAFQLTYLKIFFSPEFLQAYLRFKYFKKIKEVPIYKLKFFDTRVWQYNPVLNEIVDIGLDKAIKSNIDSFYVSRKDLFYERDTIQQYSQPVIGNDQMKLLASIKKILDEDHTNYKMVISPLYDQKKIDSTDLNYLYAEFGKKNVYNFSGVNDMTKSIYNYYEISHYRPFIATMVMDSIYANNQ